MNRQVRLLPTLLCRGGFVRLIHANDDTSDVAKGDCSLGGLIRAVLVVTLASASLPGGFARRSSALEVSWIVAAELDEKHGFLDQARVIVASIVIAEATQSQPLHMVHLDGASIRPSHRLRLHPRRQRRSGCSFL